MSGHFRTGNFAGRPEKLSNRPVLTDERDRDALPVRKRAAFHCARGGLLNSPPFLRIDVIDLVGAGGGISAKCVTDLKTGAHCLFERRRWV
jgi:hypothetical protein